MVERFYTYSCVYLVLLKKKECGVRNYEAANCFFTFSCIPINPNHIKHSYGILELCIPDNNNNIAYSIPQLPT